QIAYWLATRQEYVDLEGHPMTLPPARDGRAVTMVEHDGERIAALVHDVALLDDPQLVTAVRDAAGLMLANDRLQAAASARLVEPAVYFVCSEALTNVAKHTRAAHARCEVTIDGDRVRVLVADDGAGGADPAAGSGLRGLADRVEALSGSLAVTSPAGQGTRVT